MKRLFLSILAVFLLVEEWLWDILTAFSHRLFVWLHLAGFERWLSNTSPRVAMVAFLLPVGFVLPVKLAALMLFTHGAIVQGILLLLAAKLFATLLISRMFAVTKPQLLTFAWFAWLYTTITRWLRWAHEKIQATAVYRGAVKLKQAVRERLAIWMARGN